MRKLLIFMILVALLSATKVIAAGDKSPDLINKLERELKSCTVDSQKVNLALELYQLYLAQKQDSAVLAVLDTALYYAKKSSDYDKVIDVYLLFSSLYNKNDLALKYIDSAYDVAKQVGDKAWEAKLLKKYADYYMSYSKNDKAINLLNESAKLFEQIGDSLELAKVYNTLGVAYKKNLNYEFALQYYLKAMDILDKKGDKEGYVTMLNNIAFVHRLLKNNETALEYFEKALKAAEEIPDQKSRQIHIARTSLSIAMMYNEIGQYEKAFEYLTKAKSVFYKNHSTRFLLIAYLLSGNILINLKDYQTADLELDSALTIALKIRNKRYIGNIYYLKAKNYLEWAEKEQDQQMYYKAIEYGEKAAGMLEKINALVLLNGTYKVLYTAYDKVNKPAKAYYYAARYIETNEEIFNQEKAKTVQEMEAKYQAAKRKQEIEKQRLEIEKKDEIVRRQKIQRNALFVFLLMMGVLAYVTFRSYQRKKHDNMIIQAQNAELQQANEEIRVQRDMLQEQKNKIEKMHTQLQDSIRYAQRIQTAAMPTDEFLQTVFDEYFVFFRPRDIVSGDFYWAKKIDNYVMFTVADCTGHGVPGAFVSMLGISLLNEAVQRRDITRASDVLEFLRKEIKISLRQSFSFDESKDGMDMAFCVYDRDTNILQYAGANSPMYVVRQGEVIELKPVKNPVAVFFREVPFETRDLKLEKDDVLYLTTDGYIDQQGGEKGKKFMRKRFKELIVTLWDKPMQEQYAVVEQTFIEWKNGYKQIDDVCVMGVKFEID